MRSIPGHAIVVFSGGFFFLLLPLFSYFLSFFLSPLLSHALVLILVTEEAKREESQKNLRRDICEANMDLGGMVGMGGREKMIAHRREDHLAQK